MLTMISGYRSQRCLECVPLSQLCYIYMGTLLPLPSPPGFAFGKSEREKGKEAKSKATTEERNASIFKFEGLFNSLIFLSVHGVYPTLGSVWVVELVLAPELDGGEGLAGRQHSPQTFPFVRTLRMPS